MNALDWQCRATWWSPMLPSRKGEWGHLVTGAPSDKFLHLLEDGVVDKTLGATL